jgi:hypothetical protein
MRDVTTNEGRILSASGRSCPLLSSRGVCKMWKSLEFLDRRASRVGLITRRSLVPGLRGFDELLSEGRNRVGRDEQRDTARLPGMPAN